MNTAKNIGWGVIGLGRVVVESIAPGIAASPKSRLIACAGRDFDKTREIARWKESCEENAACSPTPARRSG